MFIVIEGTDGSGKAEQTRRLMERLAKENIPLAVFDFPRYGNPSCWFVEQYLNGHFGGLNDIDPKTASLFYALDRYAAAPEIRAALTEGKVVVSNRYVASNLGHQGSKMENETDRQKYFEWDRELEYNVNGLPRPELNIILHVPAETAQKLVDKKVARQYIGGKKRDIHETDLGHLQRSEASYMHLARLYPEEFTLVECMDGDRLMSPEEIHEKVWQIVQKRLKV